MGSVSRFGEAALAGDDASEGLSNNSEPGGGVSPWGAGPHLPLRSAQTENPFAREPFRACYL